MYKTETHMHVSEVSPCARLSAREMITLYHQAGYQTVMVSDHFYRGYFDNLGDLPWEEKVNMFLKGYEAAKEVGDAYGMHIILAAELAFTASPNHYLLYGIDREFLLGCRDMLDADIETFYPYAKAHGVTVVQAHPYRDEKCFPTPEYVDAIEVRNPNPRHDNYEERTAAVAAAFHKPMTGGSDAHRPEDVAGTGVVTEQEIRTAEECVRALLSGELRILGRTAEA